MLPAIASWVEDFPGSLLNTGAAAFQDPSDIPGLLSNLLYDLIGPSTNGNDMPSLITSATGPVVKTLVTLLPAPLGPTGELDNLTEAGLILSSVSRLNSFLTEALSVLPAPVEPASAITGQIGDLGLRRPWTAEHRLAKRGLQLPYWRSRRHH